MNAFQETPVYFEFIVHFLEVCVVIGIGTTVYILKKHNKKKNQKDEN